MPRPVRLRRMWWTVHRWIGIGLMILLVPISISGALLVYKDELDALINAKRWTVTGPALALSNAQYIASASRTLSANEQIIAIRYPREVGHPLQVVVLQQPEPGSGQRPRRFTVFLDPPTGAVLDKVDFRASLFGFLHVFHENLTIPRYSGRQIVGWAGVGMLILSLTGIWLWWPRRGALLRALRWRRAQHMTTNLHHLFGFWISIPLAVVSLTGIYLSWPQTARSFMSSIAPMQAQPKRSFGAGILQNPNLSADEALRLAVASEPGSRPAALFLPMAPKQQPAGAERKGTKRNAASPTWRAQLRMGEHGLVTVTIDDRTKSLRRTPDPLAGNRAAQRIRWIHDGGRGGPVWRFIVFLTGVFPPIFAVTGLLMWWRSRRLRRQVDSVRDAAEEKLVAAE
ncbi:MAG: PepSY-associated TM helix domain-containing protein [Xanthobacteraceae bacterium]